MVVSWQLMEVKNHQLPTINYQQKIKAMQQEQELSSEESLRLITTMISKAKCDYEETGVSALLWGSIITFCALFTFANNWWQQAWAGYIWLLTFFAIVPQVMISISESKQKKVRSHSHDAISGIWISFGISITLLSFYTASVQWQNTEPVYLIMYSIPTFATGYAIKFKPMLIGAIACWILAIATVYIHYPYSMLLVAAGAQLVWFIPGLILRRRYLKLKAEHV